MATRSVLALAYEDGSSRSIYCHHDGYPSRMEPLLATHYPTEQHAELLMAFGSRSILLPNPDREADLYGEEERLHDDESALAATATADDAEYVYVFSVSTGKWNWFPVEA